MRYMILVKATKDSEAGAMPPEWMFEKMTVYHEELAKAGVLLDANGLKPTSGGWRVRYDRDGKRRTIVDGPFAEAKELIAGFTMIQTQSREEAMEWSRRFPNPSLDGGACEIEVREMFELEEFGQSDAVDRFGALVRERGGV